MNSVLQKTGAGFFTVALTAFCHIPVYAMLLAWIADMIPANRVQASRMRDRARHGD